MREIVANCGEEPSVVLNAVAASKGNHGYSAASGEYGDMVALGILDPTKVTRTALQNAASFGRFAATRSLRSNAGLMITIQAIVAEALKKKAAGGGDHGGGGGMGGMDFLVLSAASRDTRNPASAGFLF